MGGAAPSFEDQFSDTFDDFQMAIWLSWMLLPETNSCCGTTAEKIRMPVVFVTPASGSPLRLFRPMSLSRMTLPLTSWFGVWLWIVTPAILLPLMRLPMIRLL